MLFIYKIKFVDEANKSRVSYWSFSLVLYFKSSQGKKNIQGFAGKPGLEYLFEYSFCNSIATFHLSKSQFEFCPDTVKHQVKHVEKKQVII